MADVTWLVLALSNALGLDPSDAVLRKLAKNDTEVPRGEVPRALPGGIGEGVIPGDGPAPGGPGPGPRRGPSTPL
jgi:hypothetical protein